MGRYIYGYLDRVQSIRRSQTGSQRKLQLIWLTGRPAPEFKTIAGFHRDKYFTGRKPLDHRRHGAARRWRGAERRALQGAPGGA